MNSSRRAYRLEATKDPSRSIKIHEDSVSRQATPLSGQLWHSESTGSDSLLDNLYHSDVSTAILGEFEP